jgi:hypothetical protein
VLLGDAHVEAAVGEAVHEPVEARAVGHGGGDGDDAAVRLGRRIRASAKTAV